MDIYMNQIKIVTDEFEARFEVGTNALNFYKVLSTSLHIPSFIENEGNKYPVNHVRFANNSLSFKNITYISFPSTLLSISSSGLSNSPIGSDFTGKIDAPIEAKCLMEVTFSKNEKDYKKIFNKYDNAYYFGNKDNPYLFLYCAVSNDITSCEIHKDTKYICGMAFSNCSKLTKIVLPDGILGISSFAFNYDVIELNEYKGGFYIGSVSNPYFAFLYCDEDLDTYNVHEDTKCLLEIPQEETLLYLPSGVTLFPIYSKSGSEKYIDNIRFLGEPVGYCLYEDDCLCKKENNQLTYVLGRIDQRVFDDVTVINLKAFKHALKEDLIIPKHIEYIVDGWYDEEFEALYLSKDSKLHPIDSRYIHRIPNIYFDGDINDYVHMPAFSTFIAPRQKQFFKNDNGEYVIKKEALIDIVPENCLKYFSSLEKVVIQEGATEIGDDAFYYCSKLKEVIIPTSVKRIGNSAFAHLESLKEIIIPSGVEELGDYVFDNSGNIEKIYLPNSIKKIGNGMLGILSPKDFKGKIYYDGTYDEFSKIDIRTGKDVIEKNLECKGGTDTLSYKLNKMLLNFKHQNIPFMGEKCWWMVSLDPIYNNNFPTFKVVGINSFMSYKVDENSKMKGLCKKIDKELAICLDVSIQVYLTMMERFPPKSIEEYINERILDGVQNCKYELDEMGSEDDVNDTSVLKYLKSIKDDPTLFISELNVFRSMSSPIPMYIYQILGYDMAFYISELLAISKEDYHKYYSDEEVIKLLEQGNKINL